MKAQERFSNLSAMVQEAGRKQGPGHCTAAPPVISMYVDLEHTLKKDTVKLFKVK